MACAPAREDGQLSRKIDKDEETRNLCLKNQAATLDDRKQPVDAIAPKVVAACQSTNDKLIQSLATMDHNDEDALATVVRKDALRRAKTYLLTARSFP